MSTMAKSKEAKEHVAEGFEWVGDESEVPFKIEAAQDHLLILDLFVALIDDCRASAPLTAQRTAASVGREGKLHPWLSHAAQLVERREIRSFLAAAECRYWLFMKLIVEILQESADETSLDDLPLPPWDVAILMQAHMLSPFYYVADMGIRTHFRRMWERGYVFPLRRLAALLEQDIWSDEASEQRWAAAYPDRAYQTWSNYPQHGGTFSLQVPYEFGCSKCRMCMIWESDTWARLHSDGITTVCGNCNEHLSLTRDQVWSLREALKNFVREPDSSTAAREILGVSINLASGDPQHHRVTTDLHRLDLEHTAFYRTLQEVDEWGPIIAAAESTQRVSSASPCPMLIPNLLVSLCNVYQRKAFCFAFTIDLVAAVIRQQSFARKILAKFCRHNIAALEQASGRYQKFMTLMKNSKKRKTRSLVPTLDVDLFWHTHQLFPKYYHSWCLKYVGRRVNHDDTIEDDQLQESFEETQKIWAEEYGAAYIPPKIGKAPHQGDIAPIQENSTIKRCPFCDPRRLEKPKEPLKPGKMIQLTQHEQEVLIEETLTGDRWNGASYALGKEQLEERLKTLQKIDTLVEAEHLDLQALLLPRMLEVFQDLCRDFVTVELSEALDALRQYPHAIQKLAEVARKTVHDLEAQFMDDSPTSVMSGIWDLVTREDGEVLLAWLAYEEVRNRRLEETSPTNRVIYDHMLEAYEKELEDCRLEADKERSYEYFDIEEWAERLEQDHPRLWGLLVEKIKKEVDETIAKLIVEIQKAADQAAVEEEERQREAEAKRKREEAAQEIRDQVTASISHLRRQMQEEQRARAEREAEDEARDLVQQLQSLRLRQQQVASLAAIRRQQQNTAAMLNLFNHAGHALSHHHSAIPTIDTSWNLNNNVFICSSCAANSSCTAGCASNCTAGCNGGGCGGGCGGGGC